MHLPSFIAHKSNKMQQECLPGDETICPQILNEMQKVYLAMKYGGLKVSDSSSNSPVEGQDLVQTVP